MLDAGQVVPFDRDINRAADIRLVQGLDLLPEQVKLQVGVHRANLGGVVRIAVVALGEYVDGIDMPHLQRIDKNLRVEIRSNIFTL